MKIHSIFLITALLLFITISKAQQVFDDHNTSIMPTYKGNKVKTILALKNTTLLVVIDSSTSAIGKEYAEAFQQYWKFTSYKFISPDDIPKYADNDHYSFFVFTEADAYMGSSNYVAHGAGSQYPSNQAYGSIVEKFSIKPNRTTDVQSFNNNFIYGIFMGGKGYDTAKPFEKLDIAHYETMLMTIYGKGGYEDMALRTIQLKSLSCITQIVKDIQSDLNNIIESNDIVSIKEKTVKVYVLCQSKEIKTRTQIYYYGNAEKLLKTKKILIDSSIADNMSVQFLSKIADIDANQIELVNSKTIQDAIEKKDENVFYVQERCNGYGALTAMFRIYDTRGKKIADFLGCVFAITEGSIFNPSALKTFTTELFNKNLESPQNRKDVQIEMSK